MCSLVEMAIHTCHINGSHRITFDTARSKMNCLLLHRPGWLALELSWVLLSPPHLTAITEVQRDTALSCLWGFREFKFNPLCLQGKCSPTEPSPLTFKLLILPIAHLHTNFPFPIELCTIFFIPG